MVAQAAVGIGKGTVVGLALVVQAKMRTRKAAVVAAAWAARAAARAAASRLASLLLAVDHHTRQAVAEQASMRSIRVAAAAAAASSEGHVDPHT